MSRYIVYSPTHIEDKGVAWEDRVDVPSLAEIAAAASKEFPGIPFEQLSVGGDYEQGVNLYLRKTE